MYYSTIGILAVLILLIENHDIIFGSKQSIKNDTWKVYRAFLHAVLTYYMTDIMWGMLEAQKLSVLLYIDTVIYFIALSIGVWFWTKYCVAYLKEESRFGQFLITAGKLFFGVVVLISVLNLFSPVLFSVDQDCVYHASALRYVILVAQSILMILTSVYAFSVLPRKDYTIAGRYRTIAFFGLVTAAFLTIQLWFPYLPLYTIAYLLGTCLLHTFVVNDEKHAYRMELEKAFDRETQHYKELRSAKNQAYTDALTGVKSKLAYMEMEEKKDIEIREQALQEFAVAVFDINNLKEVNDRKGHEAGDQHIRRASTLICHYFQHSPVFRIGGDEFAAILERSDYQNRKRIAEDFNHLMDEPDGKDSVIVAMGMADYEPGRDRSLQEVFERADRRMYSRKKALKRKPG